MKVDNVIRVAVVTTSFPLERDSTSGVFIAKLAEYLCAHARVSVFTPCSNTSTAHTHPQQGYTVSCFRYAPARWRVLAHKPGGILEALRGNKFLYLLLPLFLLCMFASSVRAARKNDLIHANWSVNGLIAGLAGKLTGTPVVTTFRGADINSMENSKIFHRITRYCLHLSSCSVCVSRSLHKKVVGFFPHQRDKLITITNGVDDELLNIRRIYQTNSEPKLNLLTVGHLVRRKGVDTILNAISQTKHPVQLTIVGDGPEMTSLQNLTRELDLDARVTFSGEIPAQHIPDFLEQADVFVLASHSEGRPNALLEALAAGIPTIATRIEGVEEMIVDHRNGLLFTPGDPVELSHAVNILCADGALREKLGSSAREYVISSRLTWQATARGYFNLYRSILLR